MTDTAYARVATQAATGAYGPGGAYASYGDPYGGASVGFGGPGAGYGGGFGGGMGVAGYGDGYGYSAGMGGMGDLTGTGFAVGFMGGDSRSQSRRIDAMINQLLQALMAGNLDALETAITLCTQKARMTIAQAAVRTIRAMQLYDRQQQQISDRMGALAGHGDTSTMAPQLAQMNTQSSMIQSGRQMVTNNLRDLMTMQEEIGNTEKGIRDTMSRIKSAQSRWS
jgi:hypothetical protein